ncbi:HXXXD-type acyl-transferase family protein [Rhynchospora pubera]|uniref:HXXXD-type acyl-transferase family protein n=1 Tax=Rhynchospora pubera TaxID=906938 RepID=A0AAV8EBT3_9POAL|nr:HXXXD-type acyl-transferase family protein [Rhynchospora pubera]
MAAAPPLRIIESTQISPPAGSVPETSIPLTFFDVLWLNSTPVERLFFYPYKDSSTHFTSSILPALKFSLSLALQSFFPFAGNIRLTPETTDKYEIHYVDGDSISFTAAELGDSNELFRDGPREVPKLKLLAPTFRSKNESDGSRPVLVIQVTVFPYQGLVIGITVHHSVCDGNGSVNFMRTWATICHASNSMTQAPATPILDRSIVPDNDGSLYTAMINTLVSLNDFEQLQPANEEVPYLATFTLKHEHIRFLKEKYLCEAENRNTVVRCSTTVVVYAFIWVGYLKAKSIKLETKEAHCIIAVDHRQWFQPPIPENYFGNCIGACFIQANMEDLAGPNGFFEACQAMSKAFEEVKKIGINDAKDWMKTALARFFHKPLTAAGSSRFRVYDVDFGWGKPSKVDIISVAYSGAMAVAQSREERGGVEIGLSFIQSEMEVFKNYFDENLQNVSP